MSVVLPKLLYVSKQSIDVPVWEITTDKGGKIYYERFNYPGYSAIGFSETFHMKGCDINVAEVATISGNREPMILKARDGYLAPVSWYRKNDSFKSVDALGSGYTPEGRSLLVNEETGSMEREGSVAHYV